MVTAPTADELYASAAKFAQSALDAHHKGDHQRVAIDAGTSLEHLTKACLANRSPALLVELKPGNWESLALLCGHSQPQLKQLRTVGLREACVRVRTFVSSQAAKDDLGLLISLRDGVVHAAVDEEVEERLLVAFVQQADAILADMNVPRYEFWGAQLEVVDALLSTASDKVAHRVQVKLASAKAAFVDRFADMSAEIRELVVTTEPRYDDAREAIRDCPVCGSKGVAGGTLSLGKSIDYGDYDEDGEPRVWNWVQFDAEDFSCPNCGLRLANLPELFAAGMPLEWGLPHLDPSEFEWQKVLDFAKEYFSTADGDWENLSE